MKMHIIGGLVMVKRKFICKNCGNKFEVEVFETGEAEEKKVKAYPVTCPHCKSSSVERA